MTNRSIPTLVNLPSELVEHAATFLEIKDLCNLRLVSRIVAEDVNKIYNLARFHRLPMFMNSNDSLDRAIAVVKHAAFGRAVCKVSFYIEEFEDVHPSENESGIEQNSHKNKGQEPDADQGASSGDSGEGDVLSAHFSEVDSARQTRLTTILCCLRDYGNLQEIELTDLSNAEQCPTIPEGVDKAQLVVPHPRDIRCLEEVLTAMQNAHLSVPNLSLMPERWAFSYGKAGEPAMLGLFESALQEVEHLQVHCWLLGNESSEDCGDNFFAAVASTLKLKSLTFRNAASKDSIMENAFGQNAWHLRDSQSTKAILRRNYPHLETLRLITAGCGVHVGFLRNFIRRQERLETFILENGWWCFMRFSSYFRRGETQEGVAERYFELPGTYRVTDLGSMAVRLDFTWTKDGEASS